jgi:hypothetical protein
VSTTLSAPQRLGYHLPVWDFHGRGDSESRIPIQTWHSFAPKCPTHTKPLHQSPPVEWQHRVCAEFSEFSQKAENRNHTANLPNPHRGGKCSQIQPRARQYSQYKRDPSQIIKTKKNIHPQTSENSKQYKTDLR